MIFQKFFQSLADGIAEFRALSTEADGLFTGWDPQGDAQEIGRLFGNLEEVRQSVAALNDEIAEDVYFAYSAETYAGESTIQFEYRTVERNRLSFSIKTGAGGWFFQVSQQGGLERFRDAFRASGWERVDEDGIRLRY